MNSPLADTLTRIRNAQKAKKATVEVLASKFVGTVLDVLVDEGYIRAHKPGKDVKGHTVFIVELKYDQDEGAIREVNCVSKPGRRIYSGSQGVPRFYNGLGLTIVSTPLGVMADYQAREKNVGGEILCQVF
jgi:small subunit ribosomal protein S8